MIIKEIELNNFRIYKDSNIINLTPEENKILLLSAAEMDSVKLLFNVFGLVFIWTSNAGCG